MFSKEPDFEGPRFERIETGIGPNPEYREPRINIGEGVGKAKALLPKIIAAAVIVVIVYFAYQYFIGSVRNVEVKAVDTEGMAISTAGVRLFEQGASTAFKEFTGSTTAGLRDGTYRYEAAAVGYRIKAGTITVNQSATSIPISMEKDIDVEFVSFDFPSELVVGQKNISVPVSLKNNGEKIIDVELVLSGILDEFNAKLENPKVSLPAGGQGGTILKLDIPESATVKDKAKGDAKTGAIRVKYTNEKKSANFRLFVQPDISVTPATLDFGTRKAGVIVEGTKRITLTVKNKSKTFDVGKIDARLEVVSMQQNANDEETVLGWFTWSRNITSVAATESEKVDLIINVPIEAKTDVVNGNAILSTGYWEAIIPFEVEIEGAAITLEADLTYSGKYTVKKTATGYESKTAVLTLRNRSGVVLSDFAIISDECTSSWVRLSQTSIDSISPGSKEDIDLDISAPETAELESTKKCPIKITYFDPSGNKSTETANANITTST